MQFHCKNEGQDLVIDDSIRPSQIIPQLKVSVELAHKSDEGTALLYCSDLTTYCDGFENSTAVVSADANLMITKISQNYHLQRSGS